MTGLTREGAAKAGAATVGRKARPGKARPGRRWTAGAVALAASFAGAATLAAAAAQEVGSTREAGSGAGGRIGAGSAQETGPAQQAAQSGPRQTHPEATEAISKIRSPYCPGFMLEVCPSPDAEALRDSINERALAGADADAIVEGVIAAHGEEYRAFPRTDGTGLLAWVIPPVALLLGLAVVAVVLPRSRAAAGAAGAERPTEAEMERLEAALAEMEEMEGTE